MRWFLWNFLFFLSCGFSLEYTEIIRNVHFNKKTTYTLEEGFSCETDLECQSYLQESKCTAGFCKCAKGQVLSSDASKCLVPATKYGSHCEDNVQCSHLLSSGGICDSSTCSCKPGYHYLKGRCWKNVDLNEKCFKNEQCFSTYEYVGLECLNNVCKCRQNYYERMSSGCRRSRKLQESCNLDTDCGEQGKCEGMKCQPKNTQKTLSGLYNTRILKIEISDGSKGMFETNEAEERELGMQCNADSECSHIPNAVCLDNVACACKPVLFVASPDNQKCLKVTRGQVDDIFKSSCMQNSQCGVFGPNSHCQNKRCECKAGTYFEVKNKYCWTIKSLQESCSANEDCHPSETHAECGEKEKKCTCQKGYHEKNQNCVPDALKVGDPCEKDEECLFPNSHCNSSKICACKENHYLEDGLCKPGVGTHCDTDEDCAYLNNTKCTPNYSLSKQCLCYENYTHSKDFKYCLPVAGYKDTCAESFQCEFRLGDLGECKENICECLKGAHHFGGKCYESLFIGQKCTKKPDCFPGNDNNSVICLKGFCSCNYDYQLDKTGICVKTNSATTLRSHSATLMSLLFFLAVK